MMYMCVQSIGSGIAITSFNPRSDKHVRVENWIIQLTNTVNTFVIQASY